MKEVETEHSYHKLLWFELLF